MMVILDVSRVEVPRLVKSVTLPAYARRIYVAGGYTYLITDEDLKTFFLDGPARPRLVGSLPGSFRDVYVFGKRLYLLGGSFKGDKETGWLEIYDIRDPARPVRLGRVEFADYPYMVRADAKAAYIAAGSGGLIVVDCTKPERPVILSRVKKRDEWVCGLNVQGHVVYLAIAKVVPGGAYDGILRVMDVSDLQKPKIYSSAVIIEYNASSEIWDIGYNKQYVYLGSGMGLYVIDISNPYAPNIIGINEMPGSFSGLLVFKGYIMTPYIEIHKKTDFSYGIESCSRLIIKKNKYNKE